MRIRRILLVLLLVGFLAPNLIAADESADVGLVAVVCDFLGLSSCGSQNVGEIFIPHG
jgi:uncharacterized membrane protein